MCVKCLVLYLFKDVPTYFVFFINFYFQMLGTNRIHDNYHKKIVSFNFEAS